MNISFRGLSSLKIALFSSPKLSSLSQTKPQGEIWTISINRTTLLFSLDLYFQSNIDTRWTNIIKTWRRGPPKEFLSPRIKTLPLLTLIEYSLVSDGTTAGSADSSDLGVTSSGPLALLGFRALNFLDIDSFEIEMVEIVCVSVGSFPVSTGGQTVFLERLVPTVADRYIDS